jgi:hypothetical protein
MRLLGIAFLVGCGFQSQAAIPDGNSSIDARGPMTTDAEPDAMPGAAFDYGRCPATYRAALPGPSLYRLIRDGHRAWEQSDACNRDLADATHLVILETAAELASIVEFLEATKDGIAHDSLWIGGVQRPSANRPGDSWIGFDGASLLDIWNQGEPNDDGNSAEDDHKEQFAMIQQDHDALDDAAGGISGGALCECDGKRLSADVINTINANRLAN